MSAFSNIFNIAKTASMSGLLPGKTVYGDPTFSRWLYDASKGQSGFDVCMYGDSNTAFTDGGDHYSGLNDGLAKAMELLGIPLYATPLKVMGSLTNNQGVYSINFVANSLNGDTSSAAGNNWAQDVTTTSGSTAISFSTDATITLQKGMRVTGTNIPGNTFIISSTANAAVLSNAATGSGTITGGNGIAVASLSPLGSEARTDIFSQQVGDFSTPLTLVNPFAASVAAVSDSPIVVLTISSGLIPGTGYCYVRFNSGPYIKILGKSGSTINGDLTGGTGNTGTYILSKPVTLVGSETVEVYRTQAGYQLAGGAYNNSYPNQVPQDDILIIPPNSRCYNTIDTRVELPGNDTYWPVSVKGEIRGRVLYGTAPGGAAGPDVANTNAGTYLKITESGGGGADGPSTSTVGVSGGYIALEAVLAANPSRSDNATIRLYPGGSWVSANNTGSLALCLGSLYSPVVGVATQCLYFKGGAKTLDFYNDLLALDTHNEMKKIQVFLQEIVNRQKAASSKNYGRVVIAFQGGVNADSGTSSEKAEAFITNIRNTQALLLKAWKKIQQSESNLCFAVVFSPVFGAGGVEDAGQIEVKTLIREKLSRLLKTAYVDHSLNLPYSQYVASSLWDDGSSTNPSNSPNVHLHGTGYVQWGKTIASNIVLYLPKILKLKK